MNGKTDHLNSELTDTTQVPSPPGTSDIRQSPPLPGEGERKRERAGQERERLGQQELSG